MSDKNKNDVSVTELEESEFEKIAGGLDYEVDQEVVIGGGSGDINKP